MKILLILFLNLNLYSFDLFKIFTFMQPNLKKICIDYNDTNGVKLIKDNNFNPESKFTYQWVTYLNREENLEKFKDNNRTDIICSITKRTIDNGGLK